MKPRPAEKDEVVELTQEEIDELDDRADAVERGEYVDGDKVIRTLRMSPRKGDLMTRHANEIEDSFDLSPEEEADLEAAIAEADAGLLVPLEDVLRHMRESSETKH
jgi:predicted transcriptional regulator